MATYLNKVCINQAFEKIITNFWLILEFLNDSWNFGQMVYIRFVVHCAAIQRVYDCGQTLHRFVIVLQARKHYNHTGIHKGAHIFTAYRCVKVILKVMSQLIAAIVADFRC